MRLHARTHYSPLSGPTRPASVSARPADAAKWAASPRPVLSPTERSSAPRAESATLSPIPGSYAPPMTYPGASSAPPMAYDPNSQAFQAGEFMYTGPSADGGQTVYNANAQIRALPGDPGAAAPGASAPPVEEGGISTSTYVAAAAILALLAGGAYVYTTRKK